MKPIPAVYLSSYAFSLLGNSVAGVALPLILLQATGSAMAAGVYAASTAVPALLAGLGMGVVIDRVNRRTASVLTDLVSAVSVAALPVVDLVTGLNLGWFILFGILGSFGDVPGLTARETLLPAIVRDSGMSAERLMGLRESVGAAVIVVGPAAAGGLMVLLDGSAVLWVTAATSLAAALLTLLLPHRVGAVPAGETAQAAALGTTPAATAGTGWRQLTEGWTVLFRGNRFLLAVTMLNLGVITVLAAFQGLILPVHFISIGEPGMLGFVLTAMALGTMVGGGVYAAAGTRWSRRAWLVSGLLGTALGIVPIAVLPPAWGVFAGCFVLGLATGLSGSLLGVLMIERIPEHLRGRIIGTQNSMATLTAPAGLLAAALLTHYAGLAVAAAVMAAALGVVVLVAVVSPTLRTLDAEQVAGPVEVSRR